MLDCALKLKTCDVGRAFHKLCNKQLRRRILDESAGVGIAPFIAMGGLRRYMYTRAAVVKMVTRQNRPETNSSRPEYGHNKRKGYFKIQELFRTVGARSNFGHYDRCVVRAVVSV